MEEGFKKCLFSLEDKKHLASLSSLLHLFDNKAYYGKLLRYRRYSFEHACYFLINLEMDEDRVTHINLLEVA